ncbi:MAG: DUF599 domain-containing protein [Pseudomonadota bacterium]
MTTRILCEYMRCMTIVGPLTAFHPLDGIAVALLFLTWATVGWLIERPHAKRKSASVLMARYRLEWMGHIATRDPRVFDAMLLTNLREGTAFFASACLIAIGGGMALLSNTERVSMIAEDLIRDTAPQAVLEIKILTVILLLTAAFLKFVWANRVFGYCAVLAGTIPNDVSDPRCEVRSRQAGELNVTAARAFNKGLRSVYFALGALAWLVGAWALIVATVLTLIMIIRREYASRSRNVLLEEPIQ